MLIQIDRRIPPPVVLFFVALTFVSIGLAFLKGLQDPDYFWHLQTGELILDQGIPRSDPFSFTYAGAWTLHEWLSEVVIAGLDTSIGPAASLALFAAILPATFAVMSISLRRQSLPGHALLMATLLCAAVAIPYTTVRPQVLSWLLMGVLLAMLTSLRPKQRAPMLALPVLFLLWANLHGVYVLGLGVLGLYVVASLLGQTRMANDRGWMVGASIASVLAAGLTPAGLEGLTYPLRYVNAGDWGLAHIPEWQSPNFHDLVQLPLLLLIAVVALLPHPSGSGWLRAVAILSLVGALLANRNAPVAAVVAFPYVAQAMAATAWRPRAAPPGGRVFQAAAVLAVAAASLFVLPTTAGWRGVTLNRYPASSVATLVTASPASRIVTEYGWAGYAIHELYDGGTRVFVDGRNDMYPESILHDYTALREASAGWEEIANTEGVDAMLFPPDAPIVRGIAQASGWCELLRSDREVLLLRTCPDG